MSTSFIDWAKGLLSPRQREAVRPPYYRWVRWRRRMAQPKITPLAPGSRELAPLRFRLEFFEAAQIYLRVNRIDGHYMEFGSHEANTFRMALNTLGQHGQPNRIERFWAFDSFEGMPEPEGIDRQKIWRAAMNTTGEASFQQITRADAYRVTTVKGFYENSLPGIRLEPAQYPALAYLDCDYYTSTRDVLDWLEPYLRHGSLLAFDDWDCYFGDDRRGQRLAFDEFARRVEGRLAFNPFMKFASGGMAFIVLECEKVGTDFAGY